MNLSNFIKQDFYTKFVQIIEIVEPQLTGLSVNGSEKVSFSEILKDFIRESNFQDKAMVDFENLIDFQRYIDKRFESLFLMVPFMETARRCIDRVINAYSGEAVFIGDHHHIYQPDRFDKGFADFVHDKISKECYEKMSRLYRFYSVDIGPTLSEWLRIRKPDIFSNMLKSHNREPFMTQSFTHRILPLIKEDEDLEAEILAGIYYFERVFGESAWDEYPRGMWLPECCINIKTAQLLRESGIDFVILRSDQSNYLVDPGMVYELEHSRNGKKDASLKPLFAFYYHYFSKEFSFDKWTTDNPALTLNHLLSDAKKDHYYLLSHDGELVHHRFEHCGVDVSGFFREIPFEIFRRNDPHLILITPGRYLLFLHLRAMLRGENLELPSTMLPDYPTSWSCGGYSIKSFYEIKGFSEASLKNKKLEEILDIYSEFLVLRDLQKSENDPVDEDTWKIMHKMKREQIEEELGKSRNIDSIVNGIIEDLGRGVNICYDNRRLFENKIAGAGRWAYGSLDSGDSIYQTFLFKAASIIEEHVNALLFRKTNGLFKNRAAAKAYFLSNIMDKLEELPESLKARMKYLHENYSKTVTERELKYFKSKKEFMKEMLINPENISSEEQDEIFELLKVWSDIRAAKTSCAYFFDDFNNHVSEDAAIRIAEVIYKLEDIYNERILPEVYEYLKGCSSRFRAIRGQGPDVNAYEIVSRHLNILRIQHYITKYEGITLNEFNSMIKNNQYFLPHPEGASREYYRAAIENSLIGFTSFEGVELLLSRLSRDAARTAKDMHITIEKKDLENGETINRLQMEVKCDQLIAEKPYIPSAIDSNVYVSIKIDDRNIPAITNFINNNIFPILSDYDFNSNIINTIYVNKDRLIFDISDIHSVSRRKGPSSKKYDALYLKKGLNIEDFVRTNYNLRYLLKEKEYFTNEIPGIEKINLLWMEKLPVHMEKLMHNQRAKQVIFGFEGYPGLLKKIEKSPGALKEILEEAMNDLRKNMQDLNPELLRIFVLQRVFMYHDFPIGKYEIEQRMRYGRKISMQQAVMEYCARERILYPEEMFSFKLWKYKKEEIKKFREIVREEEKIRRYIHQNTVFWSLKDESESFSSITYPVLYLHGAANEANNETFYPDNEIIPRIVESQPDRKVSVLFIPGSVSYVDQYSYLKKIRRYMNDKFGINEVYGALFASGEESDVRRIMEKDNMIFTLPSITDHNLISGFPHDRYKSVSSSHLKIDFSKELLKFRQILRKCDIISIGGGHPVVLGIRLLELSLPINTDGDSDLDRNISFRNCLKEFLLKGGLLMTISAGTMVTGIRNLNYKVKKMEINSDIDGLGITNAIFQVHFEEYGLPDHLKDIKDRYKDIPVIGIDTFTALIDSIALRITTKDPSILKNICDIDKIDKIESLYENTFVLGSKTVNLNDGRISTFVDGQIIPLKQALLNNLKEREPVKR